MFANVLFRRAQFCISLSSVSVLSTSVQQSLHTVRDLMLCLISSCMLGLVNVVDVPGLSVDFPGEGPERACSRWYYQMMGFTLSSKVGSDLSPTPPF